MNNIFSSELLKMTQSIKNGIDRMVTGTNKQEWPPSKRLMVSKMVQGQVSKLLPDLQV
jgi:hypothetical protein